MQTAMDVEMWAIDRVKPYEKNPRGKKSLRHRNPLSFRFNCPLSKFLIAAKANAEEHNVKPLASNFSRSAQQ